MAPRPSTVMGFERDVDADHPDVLALGLDDAPLTETFTYTITDGISTDTATITVNVNSGETYPFVMITAGQSDPHIVCFWNADDYCSRWQ